MADENPNAGDFLEGSRETIRSAARWLVGAFGAIGAVLVAGSQLSSIGELDAGSARLKAAVIGLLVGLVAILLGISSVVNLLLPVRWSIGELAARWTEAGAQKDQPLDRRKRRKYAEISFLASNPEHMGDFGSPAELRDAYREADAEDPRLAELIAAINITTSIAAYRTLEDRFRRTRWRLAATSGIAAVGIGLFAWAANPPAQETEPASLRDADLSNSDLRGANFRNIDLSGTDLTNANLRGADMRFAKIEDVVWANTTCPDGVNSDDARSSCVGHLAGGE